MKTVDWQVHREGEPTEIHIFPSEREARDFLESLPPPVGSEGGLWTGRSYLRKVIRHRVEGKKRKTLLVATSEHPIRSQKSLDIVLHPQVMFHPLRFCIPPRLAEFVEVVDIKVDGKSQLEGGPLPGEVFVWGKPDPKIAFEPVELMKPLLVTIRNRTDNGFDRTDNGFDIFFKGWFSGEVG